VVEYKVWVCLDCGKEWQITVEAPYPSLVCDCGSTSLILKALADKLPGT